MSETEQDAPAEPVVPAPGEPEPSGDDDEEGEEEGEPSAPVEQPGEPQSPAEPVGMSPKELEALHKRLDSEKDRHAKRVGEILGEESLGLVECPLCLPNIPGFIFPTPPPPEVKAVVKAALGEPVEPEYEKANNSRTCDGCKGLGKRLSGSLVNDQRVLLCPDCDGRGWIGIGTPTNGTSGQGVNVTVAPTPNTIASAELAPEDKPATDPWGRTPDDVDYGRLPNYVRA